MTNYKDTNGVWFELIAIKDYAGNVIYKAYRECSSSKAKQLEQQAKQATQ